MSPTANTTSKAPTLTYPREIEESRSTRVPFKPRINYKSPKDSQNPDLLERRSHSRQLSLCKQQSGLATFFYSQPYKKLTR
jgi:hypothetical protein